MPAEDVAVRNPLLFNGVFQRTGDVLLPNHLRNPLGGPIAEDYLFEEGAADLNDSAGTRKTRLSELFSSDKDTLVIYSYMFGPQMSAPCVSCTSILDGLNGAAPHIRQRVNFAVVA